MEGGEKELRGARTHVRKGGWVGGRGVWRKYGGGYGLFKRGGEIWAVAGFLDLIPPSPPALSSPPPPQHAAGDGSPGARQRPAGGPHRRCDVHPDPPHGRVVRAGREMGGRGAALWGKEGELGSRAAAALGERWEAVVRHSGERRGRWDAERLHRCGGRMHTPCYHAGLHRPPFLLTMPPSSPFSLPPFKGPRLAVLCRRPAGLCARQ